MRKRFMTMILAAVAAVTAFAGTDTTGCDSIASVVEHAQWQEPWAYEALGDCYRYGRCGMEKSMVGANMCYEMAGRNVSAMAEEAFGADPTDEFGMINHLMEGLMRGKLSDEEAVALLGTLPSPRPAWALSVERILTGTAGSMKDFFDSLLTVEMTGDEMMVGMAMMRTDDSGWTLDRAFRDDPEAYVNKMRVICEKVPPVYSPIGEKLWEESEYESPDSAMLRTAALDFMHKADRHGLLSRSNMARILDYTESTPGADLPFTAADIARFRQLCPASYRQSLSSRYIEVDPADSPVERIDE